MKWLVYWLLWTVSRINHVQVWTFIKNVQYVQHVNYKLCKTCTLHSLCNLCTEIGQICCQIYFKSIRSFFVLLVFFIKKINKTCCNEICIQSKPILKKITLIFDYFLFLNLWKNKIVFRLIIKYNFVCSQVAEISSNV